MMQKNVKNIIFIAGIHGVGKTTLCKYIAKELNLEHYSASELISKINTNNVSVDKKVNDVEQNQNILLQAINKYLDKNKNYLLDGHFCLIDNEGNISEISTDTFDKLGIKEIIVIVDDPMNIQKRIIDRDSNKFSLEFIKEFQSKEVSCANCIAEQLKIKCSIFNVLDDKDKIINYISCVLKGIT